MNASTAGSLTTADGRLVRWFDTGGAADAPVLVWHHGTPQTGAVIAPVASAAAAHGLRVVSCARPGYPGSDPLPGRSVADAAGDVVAVLDELGIAEVVAAGASGGGPHALALAALAPERVRAAVVLAGIAPYTSTPDWFTGMADPSGLGAALGGREARLAHAEKAEFDPDSFTARDYEALNGDWGPLGADAGAGAAEGPDGEVDDDVAYVSPWGVDLAAVRCPVLLVQGGADRVVPPGHAALQLERLARGELWLRPREGHVSVLTGLGVALGWATDR
ncbi:alpha/beta fold hydrolase [Leifsonia sp. NPDC058194]|uniref:alpha/beta fold hydrolase n=1 Tax=Leifsonia sp. NPDC058194 TaxID=3346374 RepID=UPI0036DC2C0C